MLSYDFSPLFRSAIGFDRVAKMMEDASRMDQAGHAYPPYNIAQTSEDAYRISLAVAGFAPDELSIETRENALHVSGSKAADGADVSYLHHGIATRDFQRTFRLADHVKVADARIDNGLLHVDLVRELPEAMRPRQVAIKTGLSEALLEDDKKKAA